MQLLHITQLSIDHFGKHDKKDDNGLRGIIIIDEVDADVVVPTKEVEEGARAHGGGVACICCMEERHGMKQKGIFSSCFFVLLCFELGGFLFVQTCSATSFCAFDFYFFFTHKKKTKEGDRIMLWS